MAKNTTNLVAVDSLIFEGNVRTAACMNLAKMVASVKLHGFQVEHPLVVSKRGDDSYLVLQGNRRGRSLIFLRDNEPEVYAIALPSGKVPAVIHEALTPEQEVMVRIDHSSDLDREPLDQWSEFQAIQQLVQVGHDSQEAIATKLGINHTKGKNKGTPNRSYIQPRVNLSRLPGFIQEEFEKYCEKPDTTAVRWSAIAALYKAYNKEMVEFPNGDGPLLKEAWAKALEPKVKEPVNEVTGHNLTPSDARKKVAVCSSLLLKTALLAATGQGTTDLVSIDYKIRILEDLETEVGVLKAHLGGVYDETLAEAIAAMADQQEDITV